MGHLCKCCLRPLKRAKPVELKKLLEDTFVCSQVPQWVLRSCL